MIYEILSPEFFDQIFDFTLREYNLTICNIFKNKILYIVNAYYFYTY